MTTLHDRIVRRIRAVAPGVPGAAEMARDAIIECHRELQRLREDWALSAEADNAIRMAMDELVWETRTSADPGDDRSVE